MSTSAAERKNWEGIRAEVLWERNRWAVLLSHLRAQIPSNDYRRLLGMQQACDDLLGSSAPPAAWLRPWLARVQAELDALYRAAEQGRFECRLLGGVTQLHQEMLTLSRSISAGRS